MQVKIVLKNGHYFLLDTDIFVLWLRRYPELRMETIFVTGTGNRGRKKLLRPIYLALRDLNTQSFPGLHSFPGADITGRVACQGSLSFWKAFKDCDRGINRVFFWSWQAGSSWRPQCKTTSSLCLSALWARNDLKVTVNELRWWIFAT